MFILGLITGLILGGLIMFILLAMTNKDKKKGD